MRATLLIAAIAVVILPAAAAPITGETTSQGHTGLPMDSLRLSALNPLERKTLNQNESLRRLETEIHLKNVDRTPVTDAHEGAIGVAITEYAANAGRSTKRDEVCSDWVRSPESYAIAYRHYKHMTDHNVSRATAATAAFDYKAIPLTDAQVATVIAAADAPSPPAINGPAVDGEMHHVENILGTANKGLLLDDIQFVFHSEDGQPISPSDKIVDDYIFATHRIAAISDDHPGGSLIKRDQIDDASGSKAYHNAYQHYQQETDRGASNVSAIAAASDQQSAPPTDAELDALAAFVQAPSPTFDVHVGDMKLHNVGEIVGAMDHGRSIDEIHQAFHNKDGEPVYLTDEEIDSAIAGYSMDVISDLGSPLGMIETRRPGY